MGNQPDFVLVDKHHKRTAVINVVIPDHNIRKKKHMELGKDLLTEEGTEDCMGSDRYCGALTSRFQKFFWVFLLL